MPMLDPETGERLSGAAQRRVRQGRAEARAAGEPELSLAEALARPTPAQKTPPDDGVDYRALADLLDPKDPDTGLRYVRACQLVAFRQLCESDMPRAEKWKLIREFSAVIGMTHPRAALEERVRHAEGRAKREQAKGAARVETGVALPATARRA